jgi:CDP-diglyceride synthetase
MNRKVRITAIIVLFFNAVSAMFGGLGLIIDPSGETMQMPIEFLKDSPFENFLIPGIILFSVNGLFNLLVGILGVKKSNIFPILTLLCGIFLIVWLSIQIMIIKSFYAPLHGPYYAVGIALLILGAVLMKQIKSK